MQLINNLAYLDKWLSRDHSPYIKAFRTLLYGWVILNTFTYLSDHQFYWGTHSWIQNVSADDQSFFFKIMHPLSLSYFEPYYFCVLILQVLFCLSAIAGYYPLVSSFFSWYFTQALYNKVYVTMDGGNNLISIMLFYAIFMIPQFRGDPPSGPLKKYITNWTYFLARFQLCVVYFVAGHLKMTGNHWTNGTAFYYTFNVDEFTHPILQYTFSNFPVLSVVLSYATILFQISFPFLIWVRSARPLLFFVGTTMHVGIAFGMGLVSFGFAMAICYSLFFTKNELQRVYLLENFFYDLSLKIRIAFSRLGKNFIKAS